LSLPPNFLLPDERYAVVVNVKSNTEEKESLPLLLSTNKPPEGGVCDVTFDECKNLCTISEYFKMGIIFLWEFVCNHIAFEILNRFH
jgi:hypothetical protein